MNLMLRLSLFLEPPSAEDPQKESKCFVKKNTHGGFLTHLALPLTLWHVIFHRFPLPPCFHGSEMASAPLCSCSGAPYTSRRRELADHRDNKKPESLKAAVSGSLHKLAPLAAWVCCPLVGSSL